MNLINQQLLINDLKELKVFSSKIAGNLKGNEVIDLVGDLGAGKTAFVRCLVKNLKSSDTVSSPTFTIENIYKCSNFDIHHFDFYRLDQPGICGLELGEVLKYGTSVVIIEWSKIIKDNLPENRLIIEITIKPSYDHKEARIFKLKYPSSLEYLVTNLED